MNPQKYRSVLGFCYTWSLIRIFRVFDFYRTLFGGQSLIQSYSNRTRLLDETSKFYPSSDGQSSATKIDRGLLIQTSADLFRLEVSLVYYPACRQEVYDLLAHDQIDETDLSGKIFYKAYYDASKNHGKLQLENFKESLCILHRTHASLRKVLLRCKEQVAWETHSHVLTRVQSNLRLIREDEKVHRGKHWDRLGFQGDDPCTDFRGVGELGLHHLEHFTSRHPLYATQMIKESRTIDIDVSDQPWYPFALCSIHTTKLTCDLLQTGYLERQLIQAQLNGADGVQQFADALFCFLFVRCHLDWAEGVDKAEITSILQFEAFFKEFGDYIRSEIWRKVWHNDDFHPRGKWW